MKKNETIILILTLLSIGAFHALTLKPGNDWGGDFALYIEHAKNIVEGTPFAHTHYIYNPEMPLEPKNYPPVFPLLLTPVYKTFGIDLHAMKIEIVFFLILTLFVLFLIFRLELSFSKSVLLLFVVGLNPFVFERKDHILSDIPFLFFSYSLIYLIFKKYLTPNPSLWIKLSIPILLYLCYGTRNIGLLLLFFFIFYDLFKNKRPSLYALSTILVFSGLVCLQNFLIQNESAQSQTPFFVFDFHLMISNFTSYIRKFSIILENNHSRTLKQILFLLGSLIAALLYFFQCKKKISFIEIFVLLYFIPILFWSQSTDVRLLLPLFPFYFYYLFLGFEKTKIFLSHPSLPFLCLLPLAGTYLSFYSRVDHKPWNQIDHPQTQDLIQYIKKHTKSEDVLIFDKPPVMGLYTLRHTSFVSLTQTPEELFQYFAKINANYLVIGSFFPQTIAYFKPILEKNPTRFKVIYTNENFRIYRIVTPTFRGTS